MDMNIDNVSVKKYWHLMRPHTLTASRSTPF